MSLAVEVVTAASAALSASSPTVVAAFGWWQPGSVSYEWLKALPNGLVTLALGLLAAWIANGQRNIAAAQKDVAEGQRLIAAQQREVAAAKLNLDLFDRRLAIYAQLENFLATAPTLAGLDPDEGNGYAELWKLINSMQGVRTNAHFLFGPETADFIKGVFENALHLRHATERLYQLEHGSPQRQKVEDRVMELIGWLTTLHGNLPYRFRPYLDFSAWTSEGRRELASRSLSDTG